jgi:hypothetical protein
MEIGERWCSLYVCLFVDCDVVTRQQEASDKTLVRDGTYRYLLNRVLR